jgi:uncharacterized protein YndB with AHSA1/START domain
MTPAGSKLTVTTPSDLEVVMTRDFDAPRELLFDAWTQPEHLRRWFGSAGWSLATCQIDQRPGGAWRWVMRNDDGREMPMYGEYREVVRPERIVYTEFFGGGEYETMGAGTTNTLRFEEIPAGTRLVATIEYRSREARDAALATPMESGTAEGYDRLEQYVRTLR